MVVSKEICNVFSLGCVFLEIHTVLLGGIVKGFEDYRRTDDNNAIVLPCTKYFPGLLTFWLMERPFCPTHGLRSCKNALPAAEITSLILRVKLGIL
jgi:hypothetical protein